MIYALVINDRSDIRLRSFRTRGEAEDFLESVHSRYTIYNPSHTGKEVNLTGRASVRKSILLFGKIMGARFRYVEHLGRVECNLLSGWS